MIDLHMHSNYSDGTSTVEEILAQAELLNLTQIAITDHNILDGSLLGEKLSPIDFIVGIELSVAYQNAEVHLLCYFPDGSDYKNIDFVLKTSEANKILATMKLVENLQDMGYDITFNELHDFSKGFVNRVHVCKALMRHGYIDSVAEGFEKLVGDDCPAYVPRERTTLEEACEACHLDGGIAVIAHPFEYENDLNIEEFLEEIKDMIDGIECFHPSATAENSEFLVNIAERNNKIITGGSDYHGDNKPDIQINKMKVADCYAIKREKKAE